MNNTITKILLAPFTLLFGIGVSLRKLAYRTGLLKSIRFDFPIISVGNLNVGGTGKSPHVSYLAKFLSPYINVGMLSRGYKRKTKGFRYVALNNSVEEVGDEPLQFKLRHPDTLVAVNESRIQGVFKMLGDYEDLQTILMDDAYQHLSITPNLNILLTEYNRPYTNDYLLPSGRLREGKSGAERADIIIVTKCPDELNQGDQLAFEKELQPLPNQRLYFSKFNYGKPYYLFNPGYSYSLSDQLEVLVFCAIANTDYLESYLQKTVKKAKILQFPDHHFFTNSELGNLKAQFDLIESPQKIIVTTEKDAMRLRLHQDFIIESKLPIFVLPIEVDFLFDEAEKFQNDVKQFLLDFKV
ncbi:MAG: tetraacyldisaccharide 4'-kinase [Saprospiraceae bacterium]